MRPVLTRSFGSCCVCVTQHYDAADGQASQGGLVFVLILSIAGCHLSPARPSACGCLAGLTAAAACTPEAVKVAIVPL